MADEVTSGEIRTRRFDVVRKGYDRNEVEVFLAQVARAFDDFETRIAEISDSDISLGIDDAEALARELATIGGEIDTILEVARSAAEGMRVRATADAESWTSQAKAYVEESTSEADRQAHAARGSAWDEGSAMLAAATEEAGRLVAAAQTDALRIRAEAEREAIRHTADAKRASEEAIGAAENEAEGLLASSRAESERILRAANQSAELAQGRARALEDRRGELLAELESTRSSIGDLETEIESKRQTLEEPEPVVAPGYEERTHHETDGGSVRIVSGSKVVPLKPVDADSFVAEVEELHRSRPAEQPSAVSQQKSRQPSAVSYQPAEEPSAVSQQKSRQPSAVSYQPAEEPSAVSQQKSRQPSAVSREPSEEPAEAEPVEQVLSSSLPQLAGGDVEERDRGGDAEDSSTLAEDRIGSLFAQLREDSRQSEGESQQLTVDSSESQEQESPQPSAVSRQPEEDGTEVLETEGGERIAESASLIPVQNAALRSIKRLLVDLQNDALEHLRTDDTWVPGEEFTDRFSEPFSELAAAIADDADDGGAASVFATDLYDAVSSAVVAARDAGSGDRAIAATMSKVFRTWRSDEAERRVVAIASDFSDRP